MPTSDEIKAARLGAKLSQAAAASLAGLGSQTRWSEYESGKRAMPNSRWKLFLERVSAQQGEIGLLSLVADIRAACGDNGRLMQDELVSHIGEIYRDAIRYRAMRREALVTKERGRWLGSWHKPTAQPTDAGISFRDNVDAAVDGLVAFHREIDAKEKMAVEPYDDIKPGENNDLIP